MRARKNTKKVDTRPPWYLHHLHHEEERDGEGGDDEEQRAESHELGEHPGPLLTPWQLELQTKVRDRREGPY